MKGDPIPDSDHISRYVGKTKITSSGRISLEAFLPRKDKNGEKEKYLSVNWLEFFDLLDHEAAIQKVRESFIAKDMSLGTYAKFVVLNVGEIVEYIRQNTPDNRMLVVLHEPSVRDPSHSGIYNISHDDRIVGALIAQLVREESIYPARQ